MTRRAVFPVVEFKADVDGPGSFEAIVAVYGNVDRQNDRIVKGAFDASIARWRESGDPIPAIWSHNWADPHAYFGEIDPQKVRSTDQGLIVRGQADADDPTAVKIHKLLKSRRVTQWSFAYEVLREKQASDGANELLELDLFETGPTLKGANPLTATLDAKSDGTTAILIGDLEIGTLSPPLDDLGHRKGGRGPASDTSDWDGNAAMTSATTAADYRAICAGERTTGEPDERSHWALPHHKSPGAPANAAGVRAARARFGQTEGLANREAARRHLFDVHKLPAETEGGAGVDPDAAKVLERFATDPDEARAQLVKALVGIHDVLGRWLTQLELETPAGRGPDPDLATRLAEAAQQLEE
jgi:HK97 family phage prohead protease